MHRRLRTYLVEDNKTIRENLIATLGILTAAGSVYDTDTGWFTPRRYER